MKEFVSENLKQTAQIAESLIAEFGTRRILALSGNLGAGKTTFVKCLAKSLGIKDELTSPTFVLLKVYDLDFKAFSKFVHVDCYRLEQAEDLQDLGLEDYIADPEALVLIEWAEKISNLPPEQVLKIKIEITGSNSRKFIIT